MINSALFTINKSTVSSSYIYSKGKIAMTYQYRHGSRYLTVEQVAKMFEAGELAFERDLPLNRSFTFHLRDTEWCDQYQKLISRIIKNTREWLKRRGIELAYVWVLENAQTKGIHVHILIHIPAGKQVKYKQALWRWFPWLKVHHHVKDVKYPWYGDLHLRSPIYGILMYLSKGVEDLSRSSVESKRRSNATDPLITNSHYLNHRWHKIERSYQGYIIGHRMGTNII